MYRNTMATAMTATQPLWMPWNWNWILNGRKRVCRKFVYKCFCTSFHRSISIFYSLLRQMFQLVRTGLLFACVSIIRLHTSTAMVKHNAKDISISSEVGELYPSIYLYMNTENMHLQIIFNSLANIVCFYNATFLSLSPSTPSIRYVRYNISCHIWAQ